MSRLLSILIPTVFDRRDALLRLLNRLMEEFMAVDKKPVLGFISADREAPVSGVKGESFEIIYYTDGKVMTIGEKRERLYAHATGIYSWQIDDDDDIAVGAVAKILSVIPRNPDCITFKELCSINGHEHIASHSLRYDDWADNQDGYDFVRTPYMKDVIRTEIAKSVPVPHTRYGEDHEWSRAIKPHLKTEVHIDDIIYLYRHESKPEQFKQRYGIIS